MEAAPSPTSLLPPPPAPPLGRGAPGLGRGVAIPARLVEASAAGEGVGDPSCKSWRSGAGRATPTPAPVRCSPMGSEGVPLGEVMVTRTQLLEDELRSLQEELALCQVSDEDSDRRLSRTLSGWGPVRCLGASLLLRRRPPTPPTACTASL